ncbi:MULTISPECIES: formate dehydrogenase subunit gamma [Halocynthiibacter]|uniref:Formate dehydrogenase subunit gamma n=1 Tax=Halocynthiibacter halioticoli TaxID=2986804 RepID=A0AAE3J1W9_9RHOB|nr:MULTISPECIES: formate dehydrogenase subunit gamma [Halocynthiibacter]MCV6825083.1 formate dehydrogenase subunit gamma [Halocynthiibacter halioticoli]MCW4058084.1 formate dehydrogenase subunit gamma [Halocynthiibacter sp. SDUM655004]
MLRFLLGILLSFVLIIVQPAGVFAQSTDRSATGGAQTLEDIMARQQKIVIDDSFRRDVTGNTEGAAITDQLGTLGGASDPDLWRALRYGSANVTVSTGGEAAKSVIQSGGMWWLEFRRDVLAPFGSYLLLGTILLLVLFYLIRGKIRIDGEKTGETILRFNTIERMGHWILGISFILLGVTGLISLLGRMWIIPWLGKDAFATLALASKWIHNNVSFAFILGLIMIVVVWAKDNIPNRADLQWIAQGGGIFKKGVHPPAKRFNAGQKVIFWSVVLFGSAISVTGVSLLFPHSIPLFESLFQMLNATGLPQIVGYGEISTVLSPQEDMQFAQLWHAVLAFFLMAIVIAHIYIGSVGMEGAFAAVGSGEVEKQWAREHHSLWVESIEEKQPNEDETAEAK